jgi:hypothetical protein
VRLSMPYKLLGHGIVMIQLNMFAMIEVGSKAKNLECVLHLIHASDKHASSCGKAS